MASEEFASAAWLLEGWTVSIPGWLDLQKGRLRFTTPDEVVFDVPLSEVAGLVFPWYYFGGGLKLRAVGKPYRISFVKPNGVEYAVGKAAAAHGNPASLLIAAQKFGDVGDGRRLGRRWRELLT